MGAIDIWHVDLAGAGRAVAHSNGPAGWRLLPLALPAAIDVSRFAFNPRSADALARAVRPITCDMLQERAL
jgi:hypothetical protein